VQLEVALAREELNAELRKARLGMVLAGVGGSFALSGLTMLVVGAALAFAQAWVAALLLGAGLLCLAAAMAFAAARELPRKPLDTTRHRVQSELKQLKERIA
jgi:hypothetical protein